jgi:uncharacterized membrane protein YfcA
MKMPITLFTYLLVCPFVFLAGFVDAIVGGGGLISLPIYMIAGLPAHNAIATNKLSSSCGTAIATWTFYKKGLFKIKNALPGIVAAMIGSQLGAHLSLITSPKILSGIMIVVMPVTAFCVFNKKLFHDNPETEITRKTMIIIVISAFVIGIYDGFYGPGTGTFLLLAFMIFGKLNVAQANGFVKAINLTTNLSALAVFLVSGKIVILLGILAALCNMMGNYVGSRLMMKNGVKIVKPVMLCVLVLLLGKIINIY